MATASRGDRPTSAPAPDRTRLPSRRPGRRAREGRVLPDGRDSPTPPPTSGTWEWSSRRTASSRTSLWPRTSPSACGFGAAPSRNGRVSCSSWSASPTAATGTRTSSPVGSSSASPWHLPWRSPPGAAPGRAPVGTRCPGARAAARGDPAHPARTRHHGSLRHTRPGGGALGRRPGGGAAIRTPRADREPRRALRAPGHGFRGRVRRHNEPASRRTDRGVSGGEVQLLGNRRPVAGAVPPAAR
jgi:hypothetical protein